MIQVNVVQRVRATVQQIVTDATTGFNPRLAIIAASYGAIPFAINFADGSPNYYQGKFDIRGLYEEDEANLPAMATYRIGTIPDAKISNTLFSGGIGMGIDVHMVWPDGSDWNSFELRADAVHDTMISLFNDDSVVLPVIQANHVNYNREISMAPPTRPIYLEEDRVWLQTMEFSIRFGVYQT